MCVVFFFFLLFFLFSRVVSAPFFFPLFVSSQNGGKKLVVTVFFLGGSEIGLSVCVCVCHVEHVWAWSGTKHVSALLSACVCDFVAWVWTRKAVFFFSIFFFGLLSVGAVHCSGAQKNTQHRTTTTFISKCCRQKRKMHGTREKEKCGPLSRWGFCVKLVCVCNGKMRKRHPLPVKGCVCVCVNSGRGRRERKK